MQTEVKAQTTSKIAWKSNGLVEIVIGTLSGVAPETKIRPSNEPGKSEESFKVTSIMFLPSEKLVLRTGVPLNPIFFESRFLPVKSNNSEALTTSGRPVPTW